jgi:hypothetical protein
MGILLEISMDVGRIFEACIGGPVLLYELLLRRMLFVMLTR